MSNVWFVSDTHFGHSNIIEYCNRPFKDADEMDEIMVKNWNEIVGKYDRIYHLGDVAISVKKLPILNRLNGKKVLIRGNHDIFKLKDYTPYFEDIRSYKIYPKSGIICSHIPVHTSQLERRFHFNVHGHVHDNSLPDKRYINICVEKTDYRPISIEEITKRAYEL